MFAQKTIFDQKQFFEKKKKLENYSLQPKTFQSKEQKVFGNCF